MGNQSKICKNCEQPFEEQFKFCPNCGQQVRDNLTVGVLFYNTISNYFSFDARFLKSLLPLLLRPGYLARKFIEGKRLLYLHPAQLYLFVSVVFFFLLSTTVIRDQVQTMDDEFKKIGGKSQISDYTGVNGEQALDDVKLDSVLLPLQENGIPGLDIKDVKEVDSIVKKEMVNAGTGGYFLPYRKTIDSLMAAGASEDVALKALGMEDDAGYFTKKFFSQLLKLYKNRNGGQVLQAIYDTIPVSLFFLLPVFALILKLFFYRRGSYAHHLVFSFYYFSFLFTVFNIILIVNSFLAVPFWIDFLLVLSTFFYLLIAIKRFYNSGWFLSFIKTFFSSFIYLMVVIPMALIVVGLIGFMLY